MSMLSRPEILHAIAQNRITINPWCETSAGPASISLHLSSSAFRIEAKNSVTVDRPDTYPTLKQVKLDSEGYINLRKGEVLLAASLEHITLEKDLGGWLTGTSDLARIGVQVVLSDFVAPGFSLTKPGVLALELVSHAAINVRLRPGMRIAHLVLIALSGRSDIGYDDLPNGYAGQSGVVASRLYKRVT